MTTNKRRRYCWLAAMLGIALMAVARHVLPPGWAAALAATGCGLTLWGGGKL